MVRRVDLNHYTEAYVRAISACIALSEQHVPIALTEVRLLYIFAR